MKKLLLPVLFLLLIAPAMSQSILIISGTVTDTSTGNPIPNHAVTISNDSSAGWFYYNTVYTNNSGFYQDTLFPSNPSGGTYILRVSTSDCQNYLHQTIISYTPASFSFTVDFSICYWNNPCQANFTTQQPQPLIVQFADASIGGGNTRQWMFGDGGTSNQMNPSHTYSMPGYYNVTLSIGALGTTCYQTITQSIYVWDSTGGGCQAAFSVIPDSLNTPPYSYTFFNQSTGSNINLCTWNFGDGTIQTVTFPQNPNFVTHTYAQPGTYLVCLSVQSNDSSCFDMTCDTLVVGTGAGCHAAFIAMPDSINSSSQYLFFDQSSGNITTWLWNFGDPGSGTNNTSTAQNPTHIFNTPGSYNVCLTIHGSDSTCYDITCQTIVIGGGSGCQANFSYLANPAPDNHTISFTDLSTGPPTAWFWNFGDGTSSNLQNPVHTFTGPALVHTVCLTITGNNCTSTFCQNVVIQDSVTYHQVYGQVFAGNFPISLGLAMIFSLDTNTNYQPFVAVCPIDSNGVYYFTQVPDGNYYIMAIPMDSNGYLPTYYGNTISWEQATIVALGTANNPYNINLVASDQMTSGPGSASGQINMGDLPTSMLDKINMILMNEQGKAIGFTKVSSSGAFDFPSLAYGVYYMHPEMPGITSDNIKVTLTAEKPHSDVVMTFNGKSILGIRDVVSFVNRWSVYPNPVVDHITISLDLKKGIKAEVSIYNMTGQLVESREVNLNDGANSIGIPTASLPEGIYSLRVYSKEGLIISTKVVKTR